MICVCVLCVRSMQQYMFAMDERKRPRLSNERYVSEQYFTCGIRRPADRSCRCLELLKRSFVFVIILSNTTPHMTVIAVSNACQYHLIYYNRCCSSRLEVWLCCAPEIHPYIQNLLKERDKEKENREKGCE